MKIISRLFVVVFLGIVVCSANAMKRRIPRVVTGKTNLQGCPLHKFENGRHYSLDIESGEYIENPADVLELDDCSGCLTGQQKDYLAKACTAGLFVGIVSLNALLHMIQREYQD